MFKNILKYFFIFLIISINIENFRDKNISEKITTSVFIIIFIIIILKIFKTSKSKSIDKNSKPSNINLLADLERKDLSENEFKNKINFQLNIHLKNKTEIFWVADEHRIHPWSIQPGGNTVVVIFKDKNCFGYDKVKRPDRYTRKITNDYIVNNKSNYKFKTLEEYIESIFLVQEGKITLNKVWDNSMSNSPWTILEKYRTK